MLKLITCLMHSRQRFFSHSVGCLLVVEYLPSMYKALFDPQHHTQKPNIGSEGELHSTDACFVAQNLLYYL